MDIPEADAMRMFCEDHAAALSRYAFQLTGDQICAENVVQETLRRAGRHPEVVGDTGGAARAWLITTARNMIIDESRSALLRPQVVSSDGSSAPQPAGPDAAKSALNRMLVGDAMAQLSAEHRAVIRRSYYGGWTTEQIAADLEIPEASVKLRLHDALRALRQILQEMGVAQ
jgi:RNA polymerase sigma-70 factor, ECF subfamily